MKIVNSLSEDEYVLVRETRKSETADLDEDQLIALHTRIRRARNKYVKLYRRAGAVKVGQKRGRGSGKAANTRNAAKAELFEDALSRVSRQLASAARQSARELKQQRLALARTVAPSLSESAHSSSELGSNGRRVDTTRRNPGRKKREASTLAAGARRQAKRDRR
ncbi:hypothetical protein [Mycolicibacterium tusciae]|uniref:Uncharacterized protein n=1 Tax=Mycolicibacterium tusciae TaxID=75922 RepID=A0A1X0JPI4_9MYCO|nr:hypothetical protein [Mycolicibacterium tusciae]ORB64682.1 hypothetical protein BST47_15385 [Mycolicibacterium tusciae]